MEIVEALSKHMDERFFFNTIYICLNLIETPMIRFLAISVLVLFIFFSGNSSCMGQTTEWYVLKSVNVLNENEVKSVIGFLQNMAPESTAWFNGPKSRTFGSKSSTVVSWPEIIHSMNGHGIYLSEITRGNLHHHGLDAVTSIFYQEALYYSSHASEIPQNFIAYLNQEEWDQLPLDAKNFYIESGNYELVDK